MIEKLDIHDFDAVFSIMERSFPLEEYRPYEAQKALLKNPDYAIYAAKAENRIVGFAAVWQLENWLFVEHLAVAPERRNDGVGSKLLRYFAAERSCLEVEPPETETACRRVGFYQRNGYVFNGYPYEQPSLGEGRNAVPLCIMTSVNAITPEEFAKLKRLLYTRVYGQKQ